jgi:hypothetical protein
MLTPTDPTIAPPHIRLSAQMVRYYIDHPPPPCHAACSIPSVQTIDELMVEKCQPGDVVLFDRRCECCASGPAAALGCLLGKAFLCDDEDGTRSVEGGKYEHCGEFLLELLRPDRPGFGFMMALSSFCRTPRNFPFREVQILKHPPTYRSNFWCVQELSFPDNRRRRAPNMTPPTSASSRRPPDPAWPVDPSSRDWKCPDPAPSYCCHSRARANDGTR